MLIYQPEEIFPLITHKLLYHKKIWRVNYKVDEGLDMGYYHNNPGI